MPRHRAEDPNLVRLGLIVDNLKLSAWQAAALSQIARDAEFVVLNCTNSRRRTRPLKHALYYALRLRSFHMPLTRTQSIPADLKVSKSVDFAAQVDGVWQSLPPEVLQQIRETKPAAIIKFGMGLIRVPKDPTCPILSYHHGDPRHFRGRPAGFYELLSGRSTLGQVVQILSNELDAGKVVAFGETKVHHHSYRSTMEAAYRCSPLLLPQALRNALAGTPFPIEPKGRNFRLPSNATVLRFLWKTIVARIRRYAYGAFFEKHWQVATAPIPGADPETLVSDFPNPLAWQILDCPTGYRFIADPFPHPLTEGVLVEGLRSSDLQGEIISLNSGGPIVLCSGDGHFSYPGSICIRDNCYLIPEISEWSLPSIFRLLPDSAEAAGGLQVEGSPRLIDPTLYKAADGAIYLFANDNNTGHGVLKLWVSDSFFGIFREHPFSPIRISPAGARMGGAVLEANKRLYRLGQDGTQEYGDGLLLFAVAELSESSYREQPIGRLHFTSARGPHTLNIHGDRLLFDFYNDRFSPFAGLARFRSRAAKRRVRQV